VVIELHRMMQSSIVEIIKVDILNHISFRALWWSFEGKAAWREGVGTYGVVDGNCNCVGCTCLDDISDIPFKWKMATTVVGNLHPIHRGHCKEEEEKRRKEEEENKKRGVAVVTSRT